MMLCVTGSRELLPVPPTWENIHARTAESTHRERAAPKKSSDCRGCARTMASASSCVSVATTSLSSPAAAKVAASISAFSSTVGSQKNLSMRPSRSSGAYTRPRSFPVTTIGTRGHRASAARPPRTRVGSSQIAISSALAFCVLTVACVCCCLPRPASMSEMTRMAVVPSLATQSAAALYRSRMRSATPPAHSSSSSPALSETTRTPICAAASSRLNVLPQPLAPHIPMIRGTRPPTASIR
mmetsp:Transcript_11808/g.49756  ORF Transcript_11808/g.49756 Transcript_11808/m.49756 type:complete len:241 (-) Transcript_11808:310-1032(-)